MNDETMRTKSREMAPADNPFAWLRSEVDRLFGEVAHPARNIFNFGAQFAPLPALELSVREAEYRLTAELPGLSEEDIEITVADGILTLSGEKHEAADRTDKGVTISERRYGSFSRQIRLPSDVDPDRVTATIDKGVLTVTMAKDVEASARERKIAIGKE